MRCPMKKKFLTAAGSFCVALALTACAPSTLSNDYITIGQYRGLEVAQVEEVEVTDEMVESEITSRLESQGVSSEVTDRPAQNGDTVNIDFTGYINGEAFEGGSATGTDLELGSGGMIGATEDYAGFEEQIEGHSPGESFTITVQFPAEYSRAPELAGQVADFDIVLHSIREVTVPELTDEWVAENSETSKTVKEYQKEVRSELEELYNGSVRETLKSECLTALAEQVEVKAYPEGLLEELVAQMHEYYESMAEMYGMGFEDFLTSYMSMTQEQFEEQVQVVAEDTLKMTLAVELVAQKLGLEPTEEEYQAEFETLAEEYGFESVDQMVEMSGEESLREMIRQDIVAEWLADHCVQVEASAE